MLFDQARSKQWISPLVVRKPVVVTNHSLLFVAPASYSYPLAFDLLVSVLQGGLSTLNSLLDVEGGQSLCLSFLPCLF